MIVPCFGINLCCLMLCVDILGLEEDPSSTYIGPICNTKCKPTFFLLPTINDFSECVVFWN